MYNITEKEQARIEALRRYDILDTPPDGAFDRITAIASRLFNVPVAITSLVDTDRIWFKSHHGVDVQEIGRDPGLCASAILDNVPYVINDARIDPRSLANPLVAGEFGLRFYAGVPLTTHDNHNLGVLCVIDFEPRTVTEQELDILRNLAQVVMDEMELRLASRRIHQLSMEKSGLLAVLSHEIRTPMNGVIGMASLLKTTNLTEEQQEYVDIIETSGESLVTLVDHILEYSKLEAGKMEVNRQPFEIRTWLEQVLRLFAAETSRKGLTLQHATDPAVPAVLNGDPQKIRQVLINLVGNAVKFTKKGGINVTVKAAEAEKGSVILIFSVKDTGRGIPKDQTNRLFETFTQILTGAEQSGGVGLGLSICRQLVELMNGRIWLEDTGPGGTTFSFELPFPAA